MQGRNAVHPIPPEAHEFFLCKEFGWTLDHIRQMNAKDFHIMGTLIQTMYRVQYKVKADMIKTSAIGM